MLNKLPESLQFLREEGISSMFLEDVLIFSDSIGVIDSKELKELQLLLAVQDNNPEQAISLIEDCSEILNKALQSHGPTLLMSASFRGSVDVISSLIDHRASINVQDAYGWTALAYALVAGKQEAFNFLIRKGATLTLESKGSKYKNILDLIRRHQLDLSKENLNQSLVLTSKSGELKFVEKFIEMGADVTALDQDKEGWKALTWASFNGHLDVVKHLVDSGSDLNVECGENNWTALQLASKNGFYEIVEFLLDHGADINKKDKIGWSPLRFAAAKNHTKTGEILLERKADMYSLDYEHEYTPMNQAAQDGCAEFISMMMRKVPHHNLEFTTKKSGGWTPLMLACKNGHVDSVRELLLAGAKVNYQKHWGMTSLMFASKQGHLDLAMHLLKDKNLDVNAQDDKLMKSMEPQPLVPAASEDPLPIAKTMLQGSDSSTLYITRMFQETDNKMRGPGAA